MSLLARCSPWDATVGRRMSPGLDQVRRSVKPCACFLRAHAAAANTAHEDSEPHVLAPELHPSMGSPCGTPSGTRAQEVGISSLRVARRLLLAHSAFPTFPTFGSIVAGATADFADEPWQSVAQDRERNGALEAQLAARVTRVAVEQVSGVPPRTACARARYRRVNMTLCVVRSADLVFGQQVHGWSSFAESLP